MKSDYGVRPTSHGTVRQISQEEYELRWDLRLGFITLKKFNKRLKRIRAKKHGNRIRCRAKG